MSQSQTRKQREQCCSSLAFRLSTPTRLSRLPGKHPSSFPDMFRTDIELFGSAAIGLRCKDGVLLGVERILHSKLLVKGANRRIASLDEHIGMAGAGLLADGKHLASRGRDEASNFRDTYNTPVTVQVSLFQPLSNHE